MRNARKNMNIPKEFYAENSRALMRDRKNRKLLDDQIELFLSHVKQNEEEPQEKESLHCSLENTAA